MTNNPIRLYLTYEETRKLCDKDFREISRGMTSTRITQLIVKYPDFPLPKEKKDNYIYICPPLSSVELYKKGGRGVTTRTLYAIEYSYSTALRGHSPYRFSYIIDEDYAIERKRMILFSDGAITTGRLQNGLVHDEAIPASLRLAIDAANKNPIKSTAIRNLIAAIAQEFHKKEEGGKDEE